MDSVMRAAADEFGFKGTIVMENDENDVLAEAMQTSINSDSSRAKQILGWQPKRGGMVSGMHIYAAAWMANQQTK